MTARLTIMRAFRSHLLTVERLSVAGSFALTTTGLTRASGSFLTDGFLPGEEITITGHGTQAGPWLIRQVAAGLLTLSGTRSASGAAATVVTVPFPLSRAWTNEQFAKPTGRPWVRETLLPMTANRASLGGPGALKRHEGSYQLDIFYPANAGAFPVEAMADAILLACEPGASLSYGGDVVTLRRVEVGPPGTEPDWHHLPVTLSFRLDTNAAT